jgi:hypothetical protein
MKNQRMPKQIAAGTMERKRIEEDYERDGITRLI